MNLKGKDIFWLSVTGVVGYMVYRVFALGESVSEAAGNFWEGVTFDPASMGPPAQLTPGAQMSEADWIIKGYLERTPEGGTRLTPAGDEYIQQQREKIVTGKIIN